MSARRSRTDRLEPLLAPGVRFLWGAVLLVLFVLQGVLLLKAALVLLFALLAVLSGKRIRWLYFLLLAASITAFNLLSPLGRVLVRIGPLPVTRGALGSGLTKALTIVGLVFVSLFTVSRNLSLPGRFGAFLGRSFYYFERLYAEKKRIRRQHVWEDVDAILARVFVAPSPGEAKREGGRSTAAGLALAAAMVALTAGALFLPAGLFPALQ